MPGIYGFVRKGQSDEASNRRLIEAMRSRLEHFPEYASETYACDWCAIGNTALPVPGEQRFAVDQSIGRAATFSGYLYGWKDNGAIRPLNDKNPAQRLLTLPAEQLSDHLDGSYNAVVIDLNQKVLHLTNDRFGHRQLYYLETDDLFMFATEIKALQAYEHFDRTIDQQAVFDYFNYTYPLGDRTFFESVKLLPGAMRVTARPTGVTKQPYWEYRYGDVSTASLGELIEEVDLIYRDHFKRLVGDTEEFVMPISGGLDSRFIITHLVALNKTPRLFSHGARGCTETKIARAVAKAHGLLDQFTFIEVDPRWVIQYAERFIHLVDGMAISDAGMLLGISDQYGMSRTDSKFLNGIFGGPTNFGSGYFKPYDMAEPPDRDAKISSIWKSMFGHTLSEQHFAKFHPDIRDRMKRSSKGSIDAEFDKHTGVSEHFYNQKDVFMIKNRLTRFMNQIDCNRFAWHDHFALSSERLVDFYIKLPPDLKLGRKLFIEYFKTKFPDMAKITYQSTGVNLYQTPSPWKKKLKGYRRKLCYYIERGSKGRINFADPDQYYHLDQWYRQYPQIREYYESLLLDAKTLERGWFDRAGVEHALTRQREGGNGFYDISSLAGFELFCREFVDQ